MKVVVQRVKEGSVSVDGTVLSSIKRGFVILLGIRTGDRREDALFLADKCSTLRVFEDEAGKMNLGLNDVSGAVLVVSQFTLYGDVQRGNRPSFAEAARPEEAEPLYNIFVERMQENLGRERVAMGKFRAMMDVHILNDGPVTILINSN